mgnify:CR=1 FL=1
MRIKKQGQHLLITIDEEYENRPLSDLWADLHLSRKTIHLLKQNNSIKVFIAPDYPTLEEIRNEPYIAVGRLKKDLDCDYTLDLFITGDNLVRGASYNAIQIGWALWKLEK